jgi:hypothetical protein
VSSLNPTGAVICDALQSHAGNTSLSVLTWVNEAYRWVLRGSYIDEQGKAQAHAWSFMRPWASMSLWIAQSSVTDGAPVYDAQLAVSTVTAEDPVFYSSMVGTSITIGSGAYVVSSVSTGTSAIVEGDASAEGDGAAITMSASGDYILPSTFGGLLSPLIYTSSSDDGTQMEQASPDFIMDYRRTHTDAGTPRYFCLTPQSFSVSSVERWLLQVAPSPSVTKTVMFRFRAIPSALTDSATSYPMGRDIIADAIIAKGKALMDNDLHKTNSPWAATADVELLKAIAADSAYFEPDNQDSLRVTSPPDYQQYRIDYSL